MGIEEIKEGSMLCLKFKNCVLKLGGDFNNSSVLHYLMSLAESTKNVLSEVLIWGIKHLVL